MPAGEAGGTPSPSRRSTPKINADLWFTGEPKIGVDHEATAATVSERVAGGDTEVHVTKVAQTGRAGGQGRVRESGWLGQTSWWMGCVGSLGPV